MTVEVEPEPVLHGRGAFTPAGHDNSPLDARVWYYRFRLLKTMDGLHPERDLDHLAVWYGVEAIRQRILKLGYAGNRLGPPTTPGVFGPRMKWAVEWFQRQAGLKVDGIAGPATCKELWRPLVGSIANAHGVPAKDLWGMTMLESGGGDPGAVSGTYDPDYGPDLGLCQINRHFNAQVSVEEAFTPVKALEWSARRLALARVEFDERGPDLQRACSIAQHNSPLAARVWYAVGSVGEDEKIAIYVARVLKLADSY